MMHRDFPPTVDIAPDRVELGRRAGLRAAALLERALQLHESARLLLAAAPSQTETLRTLASAGNIDWPRVTIFHMDEYLDLHNAAPQRFANWLVQNFVSLAAGATLERMQPDLPNPARAYQDKLGTEPFDVALMGVGVNGHLAFNDPPADLATTESVAVVDLDIACRQQQVDEGLFANLNDVPRQALTLTVPRLLAARSIVCSVPGASKRAAIIAALNGPISGQTPASAIRTHPQAWLYLDQHSAP